MRKTIADPRMLSPRRRSRRGIALLMTFVIVVIYLTLSIHLQYVAIYYVRSVNSSKDRLYAQMTAKSGIVKAKASLRLDENAAFDSLNETWANTKQLAMQSGVDYPDNAGIQDVSAETSDESGKFNLNLLAWAQKNGERDMQKKVEDAFSRLIYIMRRNDRRLDLDSDEPDYEGPTDDASPGVIIRALTEYLTDDRANDVGKSATYAFDPRDRDGAVAKQGPWPAITIGELLAAEKMNERILYGPRYRRDGGQAPPETSPGYDYVENRRDPATGLELSNRQIAENQAGEERVQESEDRSRSKVPLGLADYITIWGDGRVNINTCEREVLLALSESMTWEMSTAILRARDAAFDRSARVSEGNVADDVNPNDPNAADKEEEDKRSFRDGTGVPATQPTGNPPAGNPPAGNPPAGNQPGATPPANTNDIGTALAFYNRIAGALADSDADFREFDYEPAKTLEDVPQEWRNVFEELQPFLTVRSEYFRIVSKASAASEDDPKAGSKSPRQYCTVTGVYRRVVGAATPATPTPGTGGTNTPTNSADVYTLPPEPSTSLELIFQDISFASPRQQK